MPADMLSESPQSRSVSATRSITERAIVRPSCSSRRREEQRELVASEPEGLASLAQPLGDLGERAIPDRMAVAVVDLLEVVDVEEDEREREAVLPGPLEVLVERARGSAGGCRGP